MLNLFKKGVNVMTNGIPLNPKYFKNKKKFQGINFVLNPKKSEYGVHYETLKFYRDFY